MGRILAIDFGRKRTGLAVTDPLRITANPLVTIPTYTLEAWLTDYFSKEQVDEVVIGHPYQLSGEDSESMQYIQPFINRFRKVFPNMPLKEYDERFTSVIAHRTMIDAGLGRMARRNKELVDEISATIILQDYLESKKYNRL